ncbi:MAG: hypothetical protein ACFFAS_04000 [Promethearchaeota archaeon]
MLELVEKYKVLEDYPEFVRWHKFETDPSFEVYVEKDVLIEFKKEGKKFLLIDAVVGETNGKKVGMLFFKNINKNNYG